MLKVALMSDAKIIIMSRLKEALDFVIKNA